MALLKFNNIKISGIAACVPKNIDKISEHTDIFTEDELNQFTKQVGVIERRIVDNKTCTSDLCLLAAETLLAGMGIDKDTIDLLIFVSQTPDYYLPATSIILQDRLYLTKNTAAFDVNLGCSGYIYGLSIVSSFLQQQTFNKALLLVGDTSNKSINPKDRTCNLLFGDAGTATIIEKDQNTIPFYFSLNSDGSGYETLMIEAGGFRNPCSRETLKEIAYKDGNIRGGMQLYMNGPEIFNFTIREVPKSIFDLLAFSKFSLEETDYLVFHQANKFIINFLAKKLKYPKEKIPYSIEKYGNTSSATIPLTIASELKNELRSGRKKIILSGFGVGLSWANAIVDIYDCYIPGIVEI